MIQIHFGKTGRPRDFITHSAAVQPRALNLLSPMRGRLVASLYTVL